MKCMHENCGGELQYRQDLEEKGRVGVFECNKCHCKFGVISIRKEVGCPSLKEYVSKKETKSKSQSLNASDASIKSSEESANVPTDAKTPDEKLLDYIRNTPPSRPRGRPKGSKNKK